MKSWLFLGLVLQTLYGKILVYNLYNCRAGHAVTRRARTMSKHTLMHNLLVRLQLKDGLRHIRIELDDEVSAVLRRIRLI